MDPDTTYAINNGLIVAGTMTGIACFTTAIYLAIKKHYQKKKQPEIKESPPIEENLTGLIESLGIEPSIDEIQSIDVKVTEEPTLDQEGQENTLDLEQKNFREKRSDTYKNKGFDKKDSGIA